MTTHYDGSPASAEVAKRRSVTLMIKLLSAAALLPKPLRALSGPPRSQNSKSKILSGIENEQLPEIPAGYPRPAYLPVGYRYAQSIKGNRGGFRATDEVMLLYGNTKAQVYPSGLQVFMARMPKNSFFGTERAPVTKIALSINGMPVVGEYYDGQWGFGGNGIASAESIGEFSWDRSNMHVLVFDFGELKVGIRGFRIAGVSKSDLIRVAESIC